MWPGCMHAGMHVSSSTPLAAAAIMILEQSYPTVQARARLPSPVACARTEVQRRAASVLRTGADAVIGAATGSGKTLAYLLPLLARLSYPETAGDESQASRTRAWLSRNQGSEHTKTPC